MNPFDLFPQAVRHGRLSPGYLVDAKTGAGPMSRSGLDPATSVKLGGEKRSVDGATLDPSGAFQWADSGLHYAQTVDVIIDSTYTLSEVSPFGQDGDILIYLKPSENMFHMTPDEIAGGSLTVDDSPDGLPQGDVTGGRYHIMSVAYGRDQDTGHVIDYELTCKPEGGGE